MTWAEFNIRLFGFKRIEKRRFLKWRDLLWTVYSAPHLDPKHMAKNINSFMPLEGNRRISDKQIERMKRAQAEFERKLNERKNGRRQ
jgi:hypothetical protein